MDMHDRGDLADAIGRRVCSKLPAPRSSTDATQHHFWQEAPSQLYAPTQIGRPALATALLVKAHAKISSLRVTTSSLPRHAPWGSRVIGRGAHHPAVPPWEYANARGSTPVTRFVRCCHSFARARVGLAEQHVHG